MLPGAGLAIILSTEDYYSHLLPTLLGFFALCLLASANYTINEWLDAEFDRYHPVKKNRPAVTGDVGRWGITTQYVILISAGLIIGSRVSTEFFIIALVFVIMGVVYNVKPIRSKDRAYVDVLTESMNNPLRFLMGWSAVIAGTLPPSSILLAYWMGGAFLMAVKRYAEFRFIDDLNVAASYRRSFASYSAEKLLLSCFFYAINASFFLAIFLIKYRIEFLLSFPFFAILFTWYLALGMKSDSPAQNPEKLLAERPFVGFVVLLVMIIILLYLVDIPELDLLLSRLTYS
ncbi:UbiA family prenyltransferase [Oceanicoccus sp. KOV_DT_Chl]|uniref:UbiA family prenyltransferase n=1 Tax=Oceanicoccus sp. KOV_DT_Chl TaxID=1904639 RepID=UPI00190EF943|nr:UbiA family prenyltransferase [Oceanicoccus sp. KOV_DT_Chl]